MQWYISSAHAVFNAVVDLSGCWKLGEAVFALNKHPTKPPVRKTAYLTQMKHKYSASVEITCKDWRPNDFLPHSALTLGICLPCIAAASTLTLEMLALAFPGWFVLLETSIEVCFRFTGLFYQLIPHSSPWCYCRCSAAAQISMVRLGGDIWILM